MTKRRIRFVLTTVLIVVLAFTLPLGGRTLIGLAYREVEDTESTICPDWVIEQNGTVITLGSGERFQVADVEPTQLTNLLLQTNAYVNVDRVRQTLAVRRRSMICGNRPEQGQWITIPFRATERVRTYYAEEVAAVETLPALTN